MSTRSMLLNFYKYKHNKINLETEKWKKIIVHEKNSYINHKTLLPLPPPIWCKNAKGWACCQACEL